MKKSIFIISILLIAYFSCFDTILNFENLFNMENSKNIFYPVDNSGRKIPSKWWYN